MSLANGEAQRFNHEYIGTEHVLLGIVKEGSGVGANVLKNLDVDLRRVRLEVEKLIKAGPEMVTMGKLPQTPRTKKVIEYAIEESRKLNHNYVGTEHILLGLLKEFDGVACQVLMNLGVKLDDVREEVLNLIASGGETEDRPSSPQIKVTVPLIPPAVQKLIDDLNAKKDELVKNANYVEAANVRDRAEKLYKDYCCQRCSKPATVRMTTIVNGQQENTQLCDLCSEVKSAVKTEDVYKTLYNMSADQIKSLISQSADADQPLYEALAGVEEDFYKLLKVLSDRKDLRGVMDVAKMLDGFIELRNNLVDMN